MAEAFVYRVRLAAPPPVVYQALTTAEALRAWFAEHAEVSLPQARYEFWGRSTPGGDIPRQRLLKAEPDHLLRFAWTLEGDETTAEIRLDPDGPQGTMLRLAQTGVPTWAELSTGGGKRGTLHNFWMLSIANLANHVEGRPLVPRCDFSPARPAQARVELTVDASPTAVFASLTEPAELDRWLTSGAKVDPRVGGEIVMHPGAEPLRILDLDPDRTLAHTWEFAGLHTVVRWELEGSQGRTHLTLVHSGFADDATDAAAQQESGWLALLSEFNRMHESGPTWRPRVLEFALPQ